MRIYGEHKLYLYNIKIQLLKLLEFKFDFVLSIILSGVNVLFYAFLWTSVYVGKNTIQGVSWGQMIIYSIISNFITIIFSIKVQDYINDSVKTGDIVYILSKPINVCFFWFSNDIGCSVNQLIIYTIPIIGVINFILIEGIEIHFLNVILFLLSCTFSYIILWTISFCVGAIAFWHNELGTIGDFKSLLILLLSGSFVPLWFFPRIIQRISEFLPFQYIYQAPLGILINKYKDFEILKMLLVQVVWTIFFIFLTCFVYKKAERKLIVQGG